MRDVGQEVAAHPLEPAQFGHVHQDDDTAAVRLEGGGPGQQAAGRFQSDLELPAGRDPGQRLLYDLFQDRRADRLEQGAADRGLLQVEQGQGPPVDHGDLRGIVEGDDGFAHPLQHGTDTVALISQGHHCILQLFGDLVETPRQGAQFVAGARQDSLIGSAGCNGAGALGDLDQVA